MATLAVWGTWHLGSVTAAGLAELGHRVLATDLDPATVAALRAGKPPILEPGLEELIGRLGRERRLSFHDPEDPALGAAEVVFLTTDTPVDDEDRVDVAPVEAAAEAAARSLRGPAVVVVSSQVPVGTTERLLARMRQISGRADLRGVHVPENLRLGSAIEGFLKPDRIVIGAERSEDADLVLGLFGKIQAEVFRMDVKSAEMSKHALNAYLALCISFASELGDICEALGADAFAVERALKADRRVSPRAPLRPGFGFAGGTLGRDVQTLRSLAEDSALPSALMDGVLAVNRGRVPHLLGRLVETLGSLDQRRIAILGLTYKPGTDTLRRSVALEIARELVRLGAQVSAFDPVIRTLPASAPPIELAQDAAGALARADATLIATEWPEFAKLDWVRLGRIMSRPVVFDLKGLLDPGTAGIELKRMGVSR
jgi:UDPglucose 6-dehydrogenase